MKKVAAILLVAIHLFNVTGVRLTLEYMLHQSNVKFENQLDIGNYNQENLVEIKVPLSNPYYSSTPVYERYYGEFSQNGEYYNYVMRKVINDTVYLLCIKNNSKAELNKYKSEFALAATDGSLPEKNGIDHPVKKPVVSNEYFQQHRSGEMELTFIYLTDTEYVFSADLYKCFTELAEMPPDQIRSVIS